MKYLINESKLKNLFFSRFSINLDGKIKQITNKYELPEEFYGQISTITLNHYLNRFGPIYLIRDKKNRPYLYQEQSGHSLIVDVNNRLYTETEFLDILGIPPIMSVGDLIDMYFTEEQ